MKGYIGTLQEEGAYNLLCAIAECAAKDYLSACRALKRTGLGNNTMKNAFYTKKVCEEFLGEEICEALNKQV